MRVLITCFMLVLAPAALVQGDYPNRPIRLIVTVPPGGAADFIARLVGAKIAEQLGQQVLVENRGGAGGTIATDAVAKAAPDGYTLLQNSITTHGIGPHLYSKLPYDPVRDFAPITNIASSPLILVVNPKLPATSLAELIAYAKARPEGRNYASTSVGGLAHLSGKMFKRATGIDLTHVPYKGSGPAKTDLIGNNPKEFAAQVRSDMVRLGKVIKDAGITAE